MSEKTKLEPCPFCGSEAQIERRGDRRCSTIYSCTMCGCRLETGEEWDHGRQWNLRAERPGWRYDLQNVPMDGSHFVVLCTRMDEPPIAWKPYTLPSAPALHPSVAEGREDNSAPAKSGPV